MQGAGLHAWIVWCRVRGVVPRDEGLGFWVYPSVVPQLAPRDREVRLGQGSGFRVQGSGFRVQGSGLRVQGSGLRVQGLGFWVQG